MLYLERGACRAMWLLAVLLGTFVVNCPARAVAADNIEDRTEELRRSLATEDQPSDEKIRALQEAIQQGERASSGLRTQISDLEAEKNALVEEKRSLEKIQGILTSGLIGALVTAVVAILGVAVNLRRGRAERDLKRLEVLEKAARLESEGIRVPRDIKTTYTGSEKGTS